MRVAAGVAVAVGVLAAPILASAADIYLLRDRLAYLRESAGVREARR